MQTSTPVRTRRKIEVISEPAAAVITEVPAPKAPSPKKLAELRELARDFHTTNAAANVARAKADALRIKLLEEMDAAGLSSLTKATDHDGKELSVTVGTPSGETISIAKLREEVTPDIFDRCISASKKSVTEHAGLAVVAKVTVPGKGTRNVFVKALK